MAKKRESVGKRWRNKGMKPSQLWYTPEQYDMVKRAANLCRRSMANFAIVETLAAAKDVLSEVNGPVSREEARIRAAREQET